MTTAIQATGLTRHFGTVRAVDGLDLEVRQGTVFGFLGPNGSGKTTTLHLLLGMLRPDAGQAHVLDLDVATHSDAVRRRCGVLLEHHGLYERLTAYENLDFHARLHGLSQAERRSRIRDELERAGLWERRHDRLGTWSKGMKQRLALIRALLHSPPLVFLDEPTAGFDPKAQGELHRHLRSAARDSGCTFFITTHNLAEAEALCDEVAVIRDGRVLAQGPPDSLHEAPERGVRLRGSRLGGKALAALRRRRDVEECTPEPGGLVVTLAQGAGPAGVVATAVRAGARIEAVEPLGGGLADSVLRLLEEP